MLEAVMDRSRVGRVLLVEDDERVARALARVLQADGYAIAIAHDLDAALEQLGSGVFPVVVTDLDLGPGAGDGGCRVLMASMQRQPQALRVLMTGRPREAIGRARELAHTVLQKPFSPRELAEVLQAGPPHARMMSEQLL